MIDPASSQDAWHGPAEPAVWRSRAMAVLEGG